MFEMYLAQHIMSHGYVYIVYRDNIAVYMTMRWSTADEAKRDAERYIEAA